MKKAEIIIGSAFGDEGKGLMTDYLSSKAEGAGCVVRFNGGAQAGHTVQTFDGKRHIFSHFGSGTFAGLPTYLSSFFVCNPIVFLRETQELEGLVFAPKVIADPNCPVTTPYDIMINQAVEEARGERRHGSVGVGFGETLERQENPVYALTLADLNHPETLRSKLDLIRTEWVYKRIEALDVDQIGDAWHERFASEDIRERFMQDVAEFLARISIAPLSVLHSFDNLIFEGAQGLLLDQERGWFPHVTRSHTGIRNALKLLGELGQRDVDVYYLTRAYMTRHGAGPLPNALAAQPYQKIHDPTNKPNPYQGTLRFAWFDLNLFQDTVMRDMEDGEGFNLHPHMVMTCLDQVDEEAAFVCDGILRFTSPERLARMVADSINAETCVTSWGPTRATIKSELVGRRAHNAFKGIDVIQDNDVIIQDDEAFLDQGGQLLIDAFA